MRKRLLFIALFSYWTMFYAQQESNFSHYMYNHQVINPGYVGAREVANFSSVIRSQWIGIEGAPLTQTLSFNGGLSPKKIGYGLTVMNDKIGPMSSTSFDMDLSYHLTINSKMHRLAVGLKVGVLNQFLNTSILQTTSPGDLAFATDRERALLPNVGFGAYYYTKNFYFGFAIPRLIENKEFGLERHYYLMTGGVYDLSDNFMIKPSLLLRQVNSVSAYDLTILGIYNNRFSIGGQIRNYFSSEVFNSFSGTRFSGLLGICLNDRFTIGYAYGLPSNKINSGFSSSSHEVFLRLDLFQKVQGFLRSPRFF